MTDFNDLKQLILDNYPEALEDTQGIVKVPQEHGMLSLASVPNDGDMVLVRAQVLKLSELQYAPDFAKACLAGNFFWNGTRGAKLSVDKEDTLYLSEFRPLYELTTLEAVQSCFADFQSSVTDWRARGRLYA
ncbi:MAG: type III secretion system chaperone [Succinivibrio sp.]|nr:type III secretion system chaperone [Succinivibrio sp.]